VVQGAAKALCDLHFRGTRTSKARLWPKLGPSTACAAGMTVAAVKAPAFFFHFFGDSRKGHAAGHRSFWTGGQAISERTLASRWRNVTLRHARFAPRRWMIDKGRTPRSSAVRPRRGRHFEGRESTKIKAADRGGPPRTPTREEAAGARWPGLGRVGRCCDPRRRPPRVEVREPAKDRVADRDAIATPRGRSRKA